MHGVNQGDNDPGLRYQKKCLAGRRDPLILVQAGRQAGRDVRTSAASPRPAVEKTKEAN
jgi:hypothetical protein